MKTKPYRLVFLSIAVFLILLVSSCEVSASGSSTDGSTGLWQEQPNQKIVFMSRADAAEGELYLLDKQGQITRLTNNNRHENNPALSFDGQQIAFHGGDEGDPLSWEIYLLDLLTGEETRITDNRVIDAHPDWSPDGRQIVFGSFRDAQGNPASTADIYVVNLDGGLLTQLTQTPWEDNDPEWSPDGSKIAFKSTRRTQQAGREEIYVMNFDGSDPQRLTTTSGWQSDHDPSWAPNSDTILFTRFEGQRAWFDSAHFAEDWQELTPWNVHRVDLQGNTGRLTNQAEAGWGVVLSSLDGQQVLYGTIDWIKKDAQVIGGHHRLMLMAADGSNPQPLFPDNEHTGTLEYFDW